MNARRTIALSLGTALIAGSQLFSTPSAHAQDTEAPAKKALPTPSQVLKAFNDATGSEKALEQVKSHHPQGKDGYSRRWIGRHDTHLPRSDQTSQYSL